MLVIYYDFSSARIGKNVLVMLLIISFVKDIEGDREAY